MWLYVPSAFVPESAVSTWDSSALERLAQSATSNGKHSLPRVWSRRCREATWPKLLSGVTYEPSTLKLGVEAWISSLAGIPVSPSALPAVEPVQTIPDTSGLKSCGSTATQEPATSSVRTSLDTSALASGKSSKTLPSWGRMSNGVCSKRQTLELPIDGRDCSSLRLWSTPQARDYRGANNPNKHAFKRKAAQGWSIELNTQAAMWPTPDAFVSNDGEQPETFLARKAKLKAQGKNGNGMGTPLAMAVKMWPTPLAHDTAPGNPTRVGRFGTKAGGRNLNDVAALWSTPTANTARNCAGPSQLRRNSMGLDVQAASLQAQITSRLGFDTSTRVVLNPLFVEALMGFPIGWTAFEASGTPSYPK